MFHFGQSSKIAKHVVLCCRYYSFVQNIRSGDRRMASSMGVLSYNPRAPCQRKLSARRNKRRQSCRDRNLKTSCNVTLHDIPGRSGTSSSRKPQPRGASSPLGHIERQPIYQMRHWPAASSWLPEKLLIRSSGTQLLPDKPVLLVLAPGTRAMILGVLSIVESLP